MKSIRGFLLNICTMRNQFSGMHDNKNEIIKDKHLIKYLINQFIAIIEYIEKLEENKDKDNCFFNR